MKELYSRLHAALKRGESAALCTVLSSSGSTPRGAGARMAVFPDGSIAGTIGGGAMEYRAIGDARALLRGETVFLRDYRLDGGDTLDMICGGGLRVLFQRIGERDLPWLEDALALLAEPRDVWLVTRLTEPPAVGLYEPGRGLRHLADVEEDAVAPLCRRRACLSDTLYVAPLCRAGRVYVFGGGHVAQALVPALAFVGFRVTVVENRAEFARLELFRGADEALLTDFGALELNIRREDCVVVMTRGHRDDYAVLRCALTTGAGYIGVIGSKKKAALTVERLRGDGFSEADIGRVHTPIGLPIGAETPEEIAVSIAAELIAHRAEG